MEKASKAKKAEAQPRSVSLPRADIPEAIAGREETARAEAAAGQTEDVPETAGPTERTGKPAGGQESPGVSVNKIPPNLSAKTPACHMDQEEAVGTTVADELAEAAHTEAGTAEARKKEPTANRTRAAVVEAATTA